MDKTTLKELLRLIRDNRELIIAILQLLMRCRQAEDIESTIV